MEQSLPPRSGKTGSATAKKKRRPRKVAARVALYAFTLIGVFVLAGIVYAGYLAWKTDQVIKDISAPQATSSAPPAALPTPTQVSDPALPESEAIGLLVLGLDNRKQTGSMNTDVMMAAVLNPIRKTVTVVSVPRDSDLDVPGYKKQKANGHYAQFLSAAVKERGLSGDAARSYANAEMSRLMSTFFDIPLTYTAVLDFQGFIDVVDALGGIRVDVDQDMRWWDTVDGTDIDLKKGKNQLLDGDQALDFVRYRQSKNGETRESSDFERNDRQDRVLGALVDKLKSFGSVTKIGGVLNAIGNNVRTDIPEDVVKDMIKTFFGIGREDVQFLALTGEWKSPYVHLDPDSLIKAKKALQEEYQAAVPAPAPGTEETAAAD